MSAIYGEIRRFPQEYGPDVSLRVIGDEFYARYENEKGFTVVYDPELGRFVYAVPAKGRLVSSGVPIHRVPPKGLRRHLLEEKAVRNRKFLKQKVAVAPSPPPAHGTANLKRDSPGLPPRQRITQGKIRGLTIIVHFQDVQTAIDAETIRKLFNSGSTPVNRNFCSIRDYFLQMSGGKLDYTNSVVGPVTLRWNRSHYLDHSFAEEALELALSEYLIDLSEFDAQDEGIVDAVNFVYAGRSIYMNRLWPHTRILEKPLRNQGMEVKSYAITGIGRDRVDINIGNLCHETGHLLFGFPDLYDYALACGQGDIRPGLGVYCTMALGNRLNSGRTPSPISAFLRDLAGWCDRSISINQPGTFEAEHGEYRTAFRYETDRPNEYYLVENRTRMGLDTHLPGSGLAVYHCDTMGTDEWGGGTPDRHPKCVLIQADGSLHLQTARNPGDRFDLFQKRDGTALSHDTVPSSRAWDGTDTGFNLIDISEPGSLMFFSTGNTGNHGETSAAANPLIVRESFPDLLIPDDNVDGISSTFSVIRPGVIRDVLVTIDISHCFPGDLEVSLETPSDGTIMLHNRDWSETEDISATFDSQTSLEPLTGQQMEGDWTLRVRDLAARDTGKLNSWKLIISYRHPERIVRTDAFLGLTIPVNDWKGLTSAIPVTQKGKVRDIHLKIEVAHPFINDLMIVLMPPDGAGIVLMDFGEGGNQSDVHLTLAPESHTGLIAMIRGGQRMDGDWGLKIIDRGPGPAGVLERWHLELS